MILLNTHARTGSYLAIQLIINNLIQSKVLSKEDGEANLSAIVNALHGTELPTYFKKIKNPLEPFLGVSLDNHGIEHPFGSNFQEMSDEFFGLLESGKKIPITSANVWNESDYVKPELLKEKYGYKVFTLYRRDIKAWYVSLELAFVAGIKSFHAFDDSSADYILNKRKTLVGRLEIVRKNIEDFKASVERYITNSIPVTDGWIAYEDLVSNPQSIIETVGLDTTKKVNMDRLVTRKIPQPVDNINKYYEDPNEFNRVWSEVWTNTKK